MQLGFYGAASEVTGSNFLLETERYKIIIDCGLFQGARLAEKQNFEPFAYDPKSVDAILLTHAHLDHCGRIPLLRQLGFRGEIFSTPATRDLAELIMADAAAVMLHETRQFGDEPLYRVVDVAAVMPHFKPVEYRTKTEILPGVTLELFEAGHILGSATIVVEVDGKRLVFSGDLGNQPVPILRPPAAPPAADIVVMETTYGDRLHESGQDRRAKLRAVIRRLATQKGLLLIPAFALERTQELLYEIHSLVEEESIPALPVFLDSPLAIAATQIYYNYSRYYDEDAMILQKNGIDLFKFPLLKMTQTVGQSKAIAGVPNPKIIIAGSGMMEGGRILHHAKDYLTDSATTLLIVGYQAAGTTGRQLFEGKRRVKILGKWLVVKAHVVAITAYSAHADQAALRHWLGSIKTKPASVFLVHGEQSSAETFAKLIASEYTVVVPRPNQKITIV